MKRRAVLAIDLEELLHGTPNPAQVAEFFRSGEFHEEHYLVESIVKHLRTDQQRTDLAVADITIEMMLNGRVQGDANYALVDRVFGEWNTKLGFRHFGY